MPNSNINFDPKNLDQIFKNVRKGVRSMLGITWVIDNGHCDVAELNYIDDFDVPEWNITTDTRFPAPKQFFNLDFEITNTEQLIAELSKLDVTLELKA